METVYADYAPRGVKFFYLYKALAHPELNGYVQPYTLKERLMHVREAQRTLGSKITWLCDAITNDARHALGNAPNSEFIIDPDGKIARLRTWSNPAQLRKDLEELVGPVAHPTQVADLDLETRPPPKVAPRGVVPRIQAPGRMVPVKIEPQPAEVPFYAKLRAEVTPDVLNTGAGKVYLGFHMDPIYRVHWNNLADPIRYRLNAPEGTTVSPASGTGPQVEAEADVDPREFLVDIRNGNLSEPLELTVYYYACSDEEGWCIPVTQRYAIRLARDPDGGGVFGRSFGGGGGRDIARRVQENDIDGDGKLSRDELPERMQGRFDRMDANADGFLDPDELQAMARRFPGRSGPQDFVARLMEMDRNGDGRLSRDELPERMQGRFDRMDANADGFLDRGEMQAAAERRRRPGNM